jgi:hypothetical protein
MHETPFWVNHCSIGPAPPQGGGGLPRWGGQGWGGGGGSCDTPQGSCFRRALNRSLSERFHIDDAPNANIANNQNNTTNENNEGKYNQ